MARRATVIKATRAESKNVLLLDAGNGLWSSQSPAAETQGGVVIEGMNLLRYDAMGLGDLDLKLGADVLAQRIAQAKFPVLSANLSLASSGKLLAKPYALLDVGGRKVGIIGLTATAQFLTSDGDKQIALLNADDALAKYVAELSKKTDIIIVLSTLGYDEDVRLSSAVAGIDLIVGGRSRMAMDQAWKNETTGTLIVQAGYQGEWLGRRSLHLDKDGMVTEIKDELIYLTADYADDPELQAFVEKNKPKQ